MDFKTRLPTPLEIKNLQIDIHQMFNSLNIKTLSRCKLKLCFRAMIQKLLCDALFLKWFHFLDDDGRLTMRSSQNLLGYDGRVLGCPEGRSAKTWVDFNLYGHQVISKYSWRNWVFFPQIHKEVNAFMRFWHRVIYMRSVKVKVFFWSKMGPPHAPPKMVVVSIDVLSLNQMTCISYP